VTQVFFCARSRAARCTLESAVAPPRRGIAGGREDWMNGCLDDCKRKTEGAGGRCAPTRGALLPSAIHPPIHSSIALPIPAPRNPEPVTCNRGIPPPIHPSILPFIHPSTHCARSHTFGAGGGLSDLGPRGMSQIGVSAYYACGCVHLLFGHNGWCQTASAEPCAGSLAVRSSSSIQSSVGNSMPASSAGV